LAPRPPPRDFPPALLFLEATGLVEDLGVEVLQDFFVGEDLHQQFQFVLLLEVLEAALSELLAAADFAFEVVDGLEEELLDGAGVSDNPGVD
jgi:hypothetical protein